jgi:hypothetical protein
LNLTKKLNWLLLTEKARSYTTRSFFDLVFFKIKSRKYSNSDFTVSSVFTLKLELLFTRSTVRVLGIIDQFEMRNSLKALSSKMEVLQRNLEMATAVDDLLVFQSAITPVTIALQESHSKHNTFALLTLTVFTMLMFCF